MNKLKDEIKDISDEEELKTILNRILDSCNFDYKDIPSETIKNLDEEIAKKIIDDLQEIDNQRSRDGLGLHLHIYEKYIIENVLQKLGFELIINSIYAVDEYFNF